MSKFKVGDRVRRVKYSNYPECYGVVGQEYTVLNTKDNGICVIEGRDGAGSSYFELVVDYNDGKWHGWNGGECPVHGESIVVIKWSCNGVETSEIRASVVGDDHWESSNICAFRVVTPYVEPKNPREFWICNDHAYETRDDAQPYTGDEVIHVREVIEND